MSRAIRNLIMAMIGVLLFQTACTDALVTVAATKTSVAERGENTSWLPIHTPTSYALVSPARTLLPTEKIMLPTPSSTYVPPTILPPTPIFQAPAVGWLAWIEYGGFFKIVMARTDGMGRKIILEDWGIYSPEWSPNGQWIAFLKPRPDQTGSDIYLIRPDGSSINRVTNVPHYKGELSWSPDGRYILYSQLTEINDEYIREIYQVNVETGTRIQITDTSDINEFFSVFDPSGQMIAFNFLFKNKVDGRIYLGIMDPDGRNRRQPTDQLMGWGFSWSPDSKYIVYESAEECSDLYLLSLEDGSSQKLTNAPVDEIYPSWSPDGNWIAYGKMENCKDNANGQIYLLSMLTQEEYQVTHFKGNHPIDFTWLPLPPLEAGNIFTVTESGDQVKLRATPGITGDVYARLAKGERIIVLEEPEEADEYLWWYVRVESTGEEGWVAETPGWFSGEW